MKKRFLSLLICAAMLAAFAPIASVSATKNAISAPEGETLLFSEDFNYSGTYGDAISAVYPRGKRPSGGYNDGLFSFWGSWGDVPRYDADGTGAFGADSKYAISVCAGAGGSNYRTFEAYMPTASAVTSGIARIKMDVGFARSSAVYLTRCDVKIFDDENRRDSGATVLNLSTIESLEGNDVTQSPYKINTWYVLDCIVDLDEGTYTLTLSERASGDVVYIQEGGYYRSSLLGIEFDMLKSNTTTAWENCAPVIDNLIMTKAESVVGVVPDYNFKQDFEKATAIVTGPDELPEPPKFPAWGGAQLVSDSHNGSKSFYVTKDLNRAVTQLSTGDVKTTGKYSLKFNFYPALKSTAFIVDSQQTTYRYCRSRGQWFTLPNDTFPNNRRWYDAEIIVDLDNNTATCTVYEEGTNTQVWTKSQSYTDNLGVFEFSQDNPTRTEGNYLEDSLRIDNVVFRNVYSTEPAIDASCVKLYSGTTLQENPDSVSPGTDKIRIEFPQKIKYATVLSKNIYVTDSSDNTLPSSVVTETGYESILTLNSNLTAGETYTLHVKSIQNVSGIAMSDEYVQDFTVGDAAYTAAINNVTSGSGVVTSLDAFTHGSSLNVNYSVSNTLSSANPLAVIIAYYKITDGIPELVSSDVSTSSVPAYTISDSLSQQFVVPNKSFNKVDIMLWNDVASMNPLTDIISFE